MSYQSLANQATHTYSRFTSEFILLLSNEIKKTLSQIAKPKEDKSQNQSNAARVAQKLGEHAQPLREDFQHEEREKLKAEWVETVKQVNETPEAFNGNAEQVVQRLGHIQKKIGPEATLAAVHATMAQSPVFKERLTQTLPDLDRDKAQGQGQGAEKLSKEQEDAIFIATHLEPKYQDLTKYEPIDAVRPVKPIQPMEPMQPVEPIRSKPTKEKTEEEAVQDSPQSQQTKAPAEGSKQEDNYRNTAYTKPDSVYRGEAYNVEVKGELRTITNKSGKIIFQFEQKDGKTVVHQDNMRPEHHKLFRDARKNIENTPDKGLSQIMGDPSGVNQVSNLGVLAPEGSHAIALAHTMTSEQNRQFSGTNFLFLRQGNTYEVIRNDSKLLQRDKVLAVSRGDGKIVAPSQKTEELKLFYQRYHDVRNHITKTKTPTAGKKLGREK